MTTVTTPRLWGRFTCGGCRRAFTADPDTVPMFTWPATGRHPCCRPCWDMRNKLRAAIGLPVTDRPPSYPEDYVEVQN